MFKCPLLSCLLAFPLAALIGLVYRFPVPFAGYLSGVEAVIPSMYAVIVYSFFGLLPTIFVLGAIAGSFAPGERSRTTIFPTKYEFVASLFSALIPLLGMSVLDKIIGPW